MAAYGHFDKFCHHNLPRAEAIIFFQKQFYSVIWPPGTVVSAGVCSRKFVALAVNVVLGLRFSVGHCPFVYPALLDVSYIHKKRAGIWPFSYKFATQLNNFTLRNGTTNAIIYAYL